MARSSTNLPDLPAYKLDGWMVAWNSSNGRDPGKINVGPWPDTTRWSDEYDYTAGCCFSGWAELGREEKLQAIANGFLVLVLGDGLDSAKVHAELWKILEYRTLQFDYLGHRGATVFLDGGQCSPHNP